MSKCLSGLYNFFKVEKILPGPRRWESPKKFQSVKTGEKKTKSRDDGPLTGCHQIGR